MSGAVGVLGDGSSIGIGGDSTPVGQPPLGIGKILPVVAHCQGELVGHQSMVHQIQYQEICHLLHHQPCLFRRVWGFQHLARPHAVCGGSIGFDISDGARLPPPGVVNEQLRIHPKELVEQFLVVVVLSPAQGAPGNVAHGVQPLLFQLFGVPPANPPEIGERTMGPEVAAVAHLVQTGNANPIFVR